MSRLKTTWIRGGFTAAVLLSWLLMFFISIDHLYSFFPFFSHLPTRTLGIIGWLTFFLTVVYYAENHLPEALLVILAFFLLGKIAGPFLEPPSDPLEHLRRVYEWNCGKSAGDMPRSNRGLWHYSMAGNLLCPDREPIRPGERLQIIDTANGLFWGIAVAALYILALQAGLPGRWALLSVMICFLFYGTNRFSYFRYYSFAPSFSSLIIYWLWTAVFFFRKSPRDTFFGIMAALICLPILWVNHNQEAVFLAFLVVMWLIINSFLLWRKKQKILSVFHGKFLGKRAHADFFPWIFFFFLFIVLWGAPQVDFFRQWLSQFFLRDLAKYYTNLTIFRHGLYVGGKITGLRITDTLGIEGVIMGLIAVPYLWPGVFPGNYERKIRIFILGILPFIGYFVPFFHFIWAANVKAPEYYRLCYMSMYWLVFADILFRFGKRFLKHFEPSD